MTLNSPLSTRQLELENITNSESLSKQSQNQEEPGLTSTNYNNRGRGLKIIDGVLMSWCHGHKMWEPISELNRNRSRKCGFQYYCRELDNAYSKAKKDRPIPEGTLCAFENCSRLATCRDHDHITGQFRGFLCQQHNRMLGQADDNLQDLLDGTKYLTTYETID